MRPIKLTISAFGPYAGNVEIDFEKFLEKGIYLISGNTGAGKSTIFEAIKFALYGEDNGEIRSKYAEADVATFVDMTFALRGKEYKIKRNPKYNRPKSRGEGSTLAKAEAELIFPDGRVVSGYSNVTKEIIILTGLNSEQFSKIVMIAQGKFRELLEADTANRSKIFRDIFKTEPYDKIQRKVKTKYLEAYKENSKTTDSIKQFVQGIIINDDFCKKNHLENIMNQDMIADIDEVLELTAMLISEDEISYKNNLAKMEEGQNEINKLNGLLSVTSNNLKNLKGLEEELIKLSNYEEDYKTVLLAYEKENDLKEQREKLYVSIENLKKTVEKYKQYDKLVLELNKAIESARTIEKTLAKFSEEKVSMQKKLDEASEKIVLKAEYEKNLIKLEADIKANDDYIKKLEKVLLFDKNLKLSIKTYEEKVEIFKSEEKQCVNIRSEYDGKFLSYIEAQAGIMANKLRENPGTPCPVCGATEYIKLAEIICEAPTEEEVNNLKEKLDVATDKVMKASTNSGNAYVAMENEKKNLLTALEEIDALWTMENYRDKVDVALMDAKKHRESLIISKENSNNELKILQKAIDDMSLMKERLQGLENEIKDKEKQLNDSKLREKEIETNITALKQELKDGSEEDAKLTLKTMEDDYTKMVERFNKANEMNNMYITSMASSKAIIEQLKKLLEDAGVGKITTENIVIIKEQLLKNNLSNREKLSTLEEAYSRLVENNNNVYSRIENNKRVIDSVEIQKRSLQVITKRLSSLKVLSDTLNGEVEGKDKVKLETYVQISYFEQVIEKANTKLFEMTEGQYEFIRDISSEDKRTKSGLDLSVYDHYNGTIRSVRTLSGGEGFMAALSLALGMADIIEESASGISIDTMFIDEGFGSLDEMALEQAMKVLAKLSEGNKLVGIISHVSSLKDRIEKQINVEKKISGGSSVKVVV